MTTLRNIETGGLTRLTRQDTILLDRYFNMGLYHVLREICRKFDRVYSVKRTSLYFKSRARPAIKTTLQISQLLNFKLGLQTTVTIQINQNISKILIVYKIYQIT